MLHRLESLRRLEIYHTLPVLSRGMCQQYVFRACVNILLCYFACIQYLSHCLQYRMEQSVAILFSLSVFHFAQVCFNLLPIKCLQAPST